jgi:ornithine carbamoyltransferase
MRTLAERTGARITIKANPVKAVAKADIRYTDVWFSMGEPDQVLRQRIDQLTPYRTSPR